MSSLAKPNAEVREKLAALKCEYAFREPDRGNLDSPSIEWRQGKPDYTQANYVFLQGKTQNHKGGDRKYPFFHSAATAESHFAFIVY